MRETYCLVTALPMVPEVVKAGMMLTSPFAKLPRSKLMAPRAGTASASSCQHSNREALLRAEMAVTLNALGSPNAMKEQHRMFDNRRGKAER